MLYVAVEIVYTQSRRPECARARRAAGDMRRPVVTISLAALLAASGTQSANAIESANQTAWAKARLACADITGEALPVDGGALVRVG